MQSTLTFSLSRYDIGEQEKNKPKVGSTETWELSCVFSQSQDLLEQVTSTLQVRKGDRILIDIDIDDWNRSSRAMRLRAQANGSVLANSQLPFCVLYSTINRQIALRRRLPDDKTSTNQLTFHSQFDMQRLLQGLDKADVALTNMDLARPQTAPGAPTRRTVSRQNSIVSQARSGPVPLIAGNQQTSAMLNNGSHAPALRRTLNQSAAMVDFENQRPASQSSAISQIGSVTNTPRMMPPPTTSRPSTSHAIASVEISDFEISNSRPRTSSKDTTTYSLESPFFNRLEPSTSTPLPPRRIPPHMSSSPISTSASSASQSNHTTALITPPSIPISTITPRISTGPTPHKRPLSSTSRSKRPVSKKANTQSAPVVPIIAPAAIDVFSSDKADTSQLVTSSPALPILEQAKSAQVSDQSRPAYESLDRLKGWSLMSATARSANLDQTFDLHKMLNNDFITFCVDVERHLNRVGLDHARKAFDRQHRME